MLVSVKLWKKIYSKLLNNRGSPSLIHITSGIPPIPENLFGVRVLEALVVILPNWHGKLEKINSKKEFFKTTIIKQILFSKIHQYVSRSLKQLMLKIGHLGAWCVWKANKTETYSVSMPEPSLQELIVEQANFFQAEKSLSQPEPAWATRCTV